MTRPRLNWMLLRMVRDRLLEAGEADAEAMLTPGEAAEVAEALDRYLKLEHKAEVFACEVCGRLCLTPGAYHRLTGNPWTALAGGVLAEHSADCTWRQQWEGIRK